MTVRSPLLGVKELSYQKTIQESSHFMHRNFSKSNIMDDAVLWAPFIMAEIGASTPMDTVVAITSLAGI
jgi:hypothetical protein